MGDGPENSQDDEASDIPDIYTLPLDAVLGTENSALSNAVRRLVGDLSGPGESYAAHGTSVVT